MSIHNHSAAQPPARPMPKRFGFPMVLLASLLLAAAAGSGLLGPRAAVAQAEIRLDSLQVSLWPEYDQPSVLVILDGQLDASVPLPAELSVRIPTRAGQPHAVAVAGDTGQLITADYTTQATGDDIIVMFQSPSPGFRVEYYDPALTITNDLRQYEFAWQTGYAIAAAAARVQQPTGARDLNGAPALTSLGAAEDGLTYYQASWGALQPGDTASLSLSYTKADGALTADALGPPALAPDQEAAPAPEDVTPAARTNNLPWIAGGVTLGLALAAAGMALYLRQQRPKPAARRVRRRASAPQRRRPVPEAPAVGATPTYCTQCGQRLVAGDRFCRNCGAAVGA